MAFFKTQFNAFGLDISDKKIKIVQIDKNFRGTCLKAWGARDIEPEIVTGGEIQNPEKLAAHIKSLIKETRGKITTDFAVCVLPENKSFIKLFRVDLREDKKNTDQDIVEEVKKQLPNYIPIEEKDLRFDSQIISKTNKSARVLVGAVSKNIANQYTETLLLAGLKPLALEIEAQSISRSIFSYPSITKPLKQMLKKKKERIAPSISSKAPVIIIDLGANRSSLIFWHNHVVQFTSSLEISGNKLTEKISKDLNITWEKAEKAKKICGLDDKKAKGSVATTIKDMSSVIVSEIKKASDYYQKNTGQNVEGLEVFLTGGGSHLPDLPEFITQKSGIPTKQSNSFTNINRQKIKMPADQKHLFTSAIGLALRHVVIEDL